jgi:hypothetical protein
MKWLPSNGTSVDILGFCIIKTCYNQLASTAEMKRNGEVSNSVWKDFIRNKHKNECVRLCVWRVNLHDVRFEVLMAVSMKMPVFWVVPCNLVEVYWHFRGICCLHRHGGSKHIWNAGKLVPYYMSQQPRRQPSSTYMLIYKSTVLTFYIFLGSINVICPSYAAMAFYIHKY